MRIALVANSAWYLYNFRRTLAHELRDVGHEIVAIAPQDGYDSRLAADDICFRSIPLDGGSTNPWREMRTLHTLSRILQRERIDLVLSWTPKGNIYTGLAIFGTRTRQIANVSGLGRASIRNPPLSLLMRVLYRMALGRAFRVFFQNDDDRSAFIERGIVDASRTDRLPGSGVDLTHFSEQAPDRAGPKDGAVFLLMARMLWDKGIGEFVEAARRVRNDCPNARFQLLGPLGVSNPAAILPEQIHRWVADGVVEYLGKTDDVRPYIAAADCIVLPSSYREGVPRSLLEASAMARPCITTDTPGCRDAVEAGRTGYLCRARDAADLATKIGMFLRLPTSVRSDMGRCAREKMEREFDERFVIERYMTAIGHMIGIFGASRISNLPASCAQARTGTRS